MLPSELADEPPEYLAALAAVFDYRAAEQRAEQLRQRLAERLGS